MTLNGIFSGLLWVSIYHLQRYDGGDYLALGKICSLHRRRDLQCGALGIKRKCQRRSHLSRAAESQPNPSTILLSFVPAIPLGIHAGACGGPDVSGGNIASVGVACLSQSGSELLSEHHGRENRWFQRATELQGGHMLLQRDLSVPPPTNLVAPH